MRAFIIAVLSSTAFMTPVAAQSSRCSWVGNVWTCDHSQASQSSSAGIDWSISKRDSYSESVRSGLEVGESLRRVRQSRAEEKRAEAETDLFRAQAEAVRNQSKHGDSRGAIGEADYLAEWLKAARPRVGLYPDFDEVVFAPEVNITPDMVRLMTSSPRAADIAYYLATHRAEATAIAGMPLLEAARAIDRIDAELRESVPD